MNAAETEMCRDFAAQEGYKGFKPYTTVGVMLLMNWALAFALEQLMNHEFHAFAHQKHKFEKGDQRIKFGGKIGIQILGYWRLIAIRH